MSVFFQFTETLSNKTAKVPIGQFAYSCSPSGVSKATVLKPKVDKITITFPIEGKADQDAICEALWDLPKDPEYSFNAAWKKGGYKTAAFLKIGNERVLIQANPYKKNGAAINFMRCEFNPAKLGSIGVGKLKDHLIDIFLGQYTYAHVLEHGRVTRLDVAVDVLNVNPGSLFCAASKAVKTVTYTRTDGHLETLYFATDEKAVRRPVRVYDKVAESGKSGGSYGTLPQTRIELTLLPECMLSSLGDYANKLNRLKVQYPSPDDAPEDLRSWTHFLIVCQARSPTEALAAIPESLHAKYKKALWAEQSKLWRPDELWKHWPEVLKKSGLLTP